MKDFIVKLSFEINQINTSPEIKNPSFADFLQSLSHESLIEYYDIINSVTHGKEQDDESLQKAITLYLLIIKKLERQEEESIEIDLDNVWISAIAGFIVSEMLYRDGLIDGYEGFLYDGNISYKSNGKLEVYLDFIRNQ